MRFLLFSDDLATLLRLLWKETFLDAVFQFGIFLTGALAPEAFVMSDVLEEDCASESADDMAVLFSLLAPLTLSLSSPPCFTLSVHFASFLVLAGLLPQHLVCWARLI